MTGERVVTIFIEREVDENCAIGSSSELQKLASCPLIRCEPPHIEVCHFRTVGELWHDALNRRQPPCRLQMN